MKKMESAIRTLKEGLFIFNGDVADLHCVVPDRYESHNEMSAVHDEAKYMRKEVAADKHAITERKMHGVLSFLFAMESAAFVDLL